MIIYAGTSKDNDNIWRYYAQYDYILRHETNSIILTEDTWNTS
jgi:hypothetical protein